MEATLRERKRERTRDALAEAARRLFERHGFDATTIDDIAASADVSRRTFFRYFPTKEAVVFPNNQARLDRFREELTARGGGFEAVRHACLSAAREFAAHREELLAQHRLIQSSPTLIARELELDREWEDALRDALGRDAGRRGDTVAGAMIGALRATLRQWYAEDARPDLVRMTRHTVDLLARLVEET